jgi:hypothetical protein
MRYTLGIGTEELNKIIIIRRRRRKEKEKKKKKKCKNRRHSGPYCKRAPTDGKSEALSSRGRRNLV